MSLSDSIKEIGKHGSIYLGSWTVNIVLRLSLLPVFTRYLDTKAYGTLSILDISVQFIQTMCALGLGSAIIRYYHESESEAARDRVVSTGLFACIGTALIAGIVLYILRQPITRIILGNEGSAVYFILCAGTMVLGLTRAGTDGYLLARKASLTFLVANSIGTVVNSGLNLYLVVFANMGILGILIGNLISALLINLVFLVYVFRKVSFHFDRIVLNKMLRFGLPLAPALLAAAAMHNIDRFFIRIYSSMADVGLYSLAYQFPFMLISIFAGSFEQIWGGSTLFAIAESKDASYQYGRICTYGMATLGFAFYSASVASRTIVGIFAAPEYINAANYIPMISLGLWFYGFHIFFRTGVTLTKKTYLLPATYISAVIINVIANFELVPYWGAMGAAIATAITYGCFSFIGYFMYRKCYAIKFEWGKLLSIFVIGTCLVFIRSLIHIDRLFLTMVIDLTSILLFPVIIFVFPGLLTVQDRQWIAVAKLAGIRRFALLFK